MDCWSVNVGTIDQVRSDNVELLMTTKVYCIHSIKPERRVLPDKKRFETERGDRTTLSETLGTTHNLQDLLDPRCWIDNQTLISALVTRLDACH